MILLDTHTLLWWVGGGALSKQALSAIRKESGDDGEIVVSTITAWEIALLVRRGKIRLSMDVGDWIESESNRRGEFRTRGQQYRHQVDRSPRRVSQ